MKPAIAKPIASLVPKDAVTTAALEAKQADDKIESISFSLRKSDIRKIRNRAAALADKRGGRQVSMSLALRDILDGVQP
jgi:hypothetical protein